MLTLLHSQVSNTLASTKYSCGLRSVKQPSACLRHLANRLRACSALVGVHLHECRCRATTAKRGLLRSTRMP